MRCLIQQPLEGGERCGSAENLHVVDDREQAGLAGGRIEPRLEDLSIVVLGLEVDPLNRTTLAFGPLGQQRGLAEPRRRDDGDDRAVRGAAKPVEKGGPNDGLSGRRHERARQSGVRARQRFQNGHATSLQMWLRPAKGARRSRGCRRASRSRDPYTPDGRGRPERRGVTSAGQENMIVHVMRVSYSASLMAT